jgi:two-component system cell cycle sensor histidine kinase/response regulator CckA
VPSAADAQKAEPAADSARTVDDTGIGTVLLVEDEDAVRLFGARALRNKGYKVLEARSGEAALEIMASHKDPVDLIITDVVMPRMDGPTLIKEVRQKQPSLKVIFISGYAEDNFRRRLDMDADIHFLPKPFSLKQLAGKVKEVMREGSA